MKKYPDTKERAILKLYKKEIADYKLYYDEPCYYDDIDYRSKHNKLNIMFNFPKRNPIQNSIGDLWPPNTK